MPQPSIFRTWDDYFIPGTSVLRNKLTTIGQPYGETDPDQLQAMEEVLTSARIQELAVDPIPGAFDYAHMKAIHRHIFQDVYEWAGQERVGPVGQFMTKDGHSYYGAGAHLTEAAEAQYAALKQKNYLRELRPESFARELAEVWGELNVVHSFREGNTRAQFVFFHQLSAYAGYRLETGSFEPGAPQRTQFIEARFHSQDTGRNDRLAEVLRDSITPLNRQEATRDGHGEAVRLLRASFPHQAERALGEHPYQSGQSAHPYSRGITGLEPGIGR